MCHLGVVAVTRDDDVVIGRIRNGKLEPFAQTSPLDTVPIALIDDDPVTVYWVSKGRLVRRSIDADANVGPLEVLTTDAADGTRPAACRAQGPSSIDVALYIGRTVSRELERAARLWVDKHDSRRISDEAGGAGSSC
jgi:hypothetical protein